ncbi:ABC transporter substrate-binding protein [Rhizobium sp. CSW-27]|uniref:ABC transporter substrate-binding protein n=1 Tax=Rhizobium sp. CSW-27 TaxID=2839985 RepID=UPI001C00FF24|nr:ABC transporter substrate-binding protein [Rhizobium sp. CSW-27]MBT9371131.1 ABC transporter substrate-binding protein [Rhizobium sp. CSW-27]
MTTLPKISAVLGLLALCSAAQASAEELEIWMLTPASQAGIEALKKVEEGFEAKHPGVEVKIVKRGTDDLKTALRVTAGSATGPDIYFSWAGRGLGGEYILAGMSRSLDSYYEKYKWNDRFVPTAAAFAKGVGEGKHGVPYNFRGEALYYNKQLFERAGITSVPQTYGELKAAAQALSDDGIAAIAFGGGVGWHIMRLMDTIMETTCGTETHDALKAMKASWSATPCVTEAFKEYQFWTENYVLKPFMGLDQQQAFNLFTAGRAAMVLEGDWLVGMLKDSAMKIDNVGVFPFPTGTDRLFGFANYLYVASTAKNPDLAAEFLDYFTSAEVQKSVVGILFTNSVNTAVTVSERSAIEDEWQRFFTKYDALYTNGDLAMPANVGNEYSRVVQAVAAGDMTPEAAAKTMQAFIDNKN